MNLKVRNYGHEDQKGKKCQESHKFLDLVSQVLTSRGASATKKTGCQLFVLDVFEEEEYRDKVMVQLSNWGPSAREVFYFEQLFVFYLVHKQSYCCKSQKMDRARQ